MTYYVDVYENGTLDITLVETLTDRRYGHGKEYVKYKMANFHWSCYDNYSEEHYITSGVWNWETVEYHYFGRKVI
jgi:hypothetical protein